MGDYYIGLLSGTSMDGVDCALVDFEANSAQLVDTHYQAMPEPLKQDLLKLCHGHDCELDHCGQLDHQLGKLFAQSVNQLLETSSI